MTETPPPGPTTAAEAAQYAEERLSDAPPMTSYGPTGYPGEPVGHGRWVMMEVHGEDLGWLWTNDGDALGYFPTTDAGIQYQPEFKVALTAAYAFGSPATEVFDAYASRAGLGLAAQQVHTGDLGAWFQAL